MSGKQGYVSSCTPNPENWPAAGNQSVLAQIDGLLNNIRAK